LLFHLHAALFSSLTRSHTHVCSLAPAENALPEVEIPASCCTASAADLANPHDIGNFFLSKAFECVVCVSTWVFK